MSLQKNNYNSGDDTISHFFVGLYIVGVIAFLFYVGNQDMFISDNIGSIVAAVFWGHIITFGISTFIINLLANSQENLKHLDLDKTADYIQEIIGKSFEYNSKSNRPEFWLFFLWTTLVSIGLFIIDYNILYYKFYENSLIDMSTIFGLVTFLPFIAVGTRRLNDTGRSGWLQLMAFTIIGLIPLIIFWAQESKTNINKLNPIDPSKMTDELERLSQMYKDEIISENEFTRAKSKLLD